MVRRPSGAVAVLDVIPDTAPHSISRAGSDVSQLQAPPRLGSLGAGVLLLLLLHTSCSVGVGTGSGVEPIDSPQRIDFSCAEAGYG